MPSGLPPCDLLARLTGRPILVLDLHGAILASGGATGVDLPDRIGTASDLRRMAKSTIATPATWDINGQVWRAFGMRWPSREPRILVRMVPREATAFNAVSDRLRALEERQVEVRAALGRALVAEAEMMAAAEQLRQTNQELEEYAALVAHDLRAPIRTARLLADRTYDAAANKKDMCLAKDLWIRLEETLGRLDALVMKLLDYASLRDSGLNPEDCAAAELIETAVTDLGSTLESNDVELTIEACGRLHVDRDLISVAVRELVLNAIKYRDPDRRARVDVRVTCGDGESVLTVSDNGIGIPAERRSDAFEMFNRLSAGAADGLGFGLTYCRRIVELHGGRIELGVGIDGVGTTVVVTFPLDRKVVEDVPQALAA